jgi:hypothetical protein
MLIGTNYSSDNTLFAYKSKNRDNPTFNAESLVEKEEISDKQKDTDFDEKAFETVGPNAPENVKKAWMDAAKETGVNGLGIKSNGMLGHISQMMVQRVKNWYNGESNSTDILGNTVDSAISATKQALYDLDNPLEPNSKKSIEVQHLLVQERAFYNAFLEKLQSL